MRLLKQNKVEWWPQAKNYLSYKKKTVSIRLVKQVNGSGYRTQKPTRACVETWYMTEVALQISEGRMGYGINGLRQSDIMYIWKKYSWFPTSHHIQKNKFHVDKRPKCEKQNCKLSEEKIGDYFYDLRVGRIS